MFFSGLAFAELASLFAVAGGVVVLLYILKLRRRTVAVPFAPLWERILRDKDATTLFSRLKRLLSLLLQLLLLALLVFALGDPRAVETLLQGRTFVVLIDASASMQATDVAPSRMGAAKEQAKKMIRGMGGADRMLLAQMDAMVTPLGPMTGDTADLERMLDRVHVTDARADFPRALRFATDSLRGASEGEVVVISDGALGEARDASGAVSMGAAKLVFVPIGNAARNVAITQFSVRRYPLDKSRYEVMIEVTNTGPEEEQIELSLIGDGQVVDMTKLKLRPAERLPRFYPNLSGASRTLEATLVPLEGSVDVLAADNHAYALLPERQRAKVLVVTEGNTYLEAALLLDEYLEVTEVTPKKYPEKSSERWDVVVFDRVTPTELPKAHALFLDPRGPGAPVKVDVELKQPGFDKIDRKHPIVRHTALDDVNIALGHKLIAEPGDKAVGVSEGASPILVAGTRKGYKFVALGFDLRDSDLPLRIAWPLLVLNTVNWFTGEDSNYLSSFRTGDIWRIPVVAGAKEAIVKLPAGATERVPVHEGRAVLLGLYAGFYELSVGDEKTPFAANLIDEAESAVAPMDKLLVGGKEAGQLGGFKVGVRREIWIYVLLLVVLLTALEWATYHRRVTV